MPRPAPTRRPADPLKEAAGASAAALAAHARYRATFEYAPVGIASVALDGRWVMVNDALCRLLGYSRAELLQTDFQQLTHPDDLAPDLAQAQRLLAGEIPSYAMEKRYRRKDGSYVWAQMTGAAVRDAAGRTLEFVAIVEDITAAKQAEQELARARSRLDSALTASEVGTYEWDVVRDRVYADVNFLSIQPVELDADGAVSVARIFAHFHPEDRGRVEAAVQHSLRSGDPYEADYRYLVGDTERWITARGRMRRDATGRVVGFFGTVMDVTKRKLAELDRERLAAALQKAKETAEQASQAKDHFLAVLSHELRTPLTPVLTAAQLLENDASLQPAQQELVHTIRRNVELEARLIDDLLDLTRIARNKVALHIAAVSVHEKIKEVLGMCAEDIARKSLTCDTRLLARPDTVNADGARLQQVIWNVVKNAVKFTPAGGRLEIATAIEGSSLRIVVTDTGIGIPAEILPHVFEAFEQGSRDITREFGGLGLGLAISKALIELHGGSISAASEGAGRGATFVLRMPGASASVATAGSPPRELDPSLACTVLLVEDHPDTRRGFTLLLRRLGCRVIATATAHEALAAARDAAYDLVISDLGLPDASGLELVRQLKQLRPTPAIALSGYGTENDHAHSAAAGFDAHLVKPVRFELLVETIRRVLRNQT
jgi:PAS domain S-box-containing protein